MRLVTTNLCSYQWGPLRQKGVKVQQDKPKIKFASESLLQVIYMAMLQLYIYNQMEVFKVWLIQSEKMQR